MTTRSRDTRRGPVAYARRVQGPRVRAGSSDDPLHGWRAWLRTMLRFLAPQWLLIHAFCFGAAITMILLGRWQLQVSDAKHFDLQNFSYVIQWWVFAAFALAFWVRLVRDALRPPPPRVSPGGAVALRTGTGTSLNSAYTGPAELVVAGNGSAGDQPLVYRGYVIPESSRSLHRSQDDEYHESYNDYLWELSLADAEHEVSAAPSVPSGSGHVASDRTARGTVIDVDSVDDPPA